MKKRIFSFSLVVVGFFLGATALSALAQTWSPPGTGYPAGTNCTPPNCNTPAPINVGSNWQAKTGSLTVGASTCNKDASGNCITLDVGSGGGLFNSLGVISQLVYGGSGSSVTSLGGLPPAKGEVLTALDATGTVGWGAGNNQSSVQHNIEVYSTPGNETWVAPIGVTTIDVKAIGGGGKSGLGCNNEFGAAFGGPGGHATQAESVVTVNPEQSYTVIVGAVGNQQASSFGTTVLASGGGNGGNATCGSYATNGDTGTSYQTASDLGQLILSESNMPPYGGSDSSGIVIINY